MPSTHLDLPALPEGLTTRPLTMADLPAVFDNVAASETMTTGKAEIEVEDIDSDWRRASFDLARDSVGIFDGDRLAASAEVFQGRRADADVHPDYLGRGLGTWLAAWTRATAARGGGTLVGQTVVADSPAERLFQRQGYRVGWTSWVLQMPEGAVIEPQPLPQGYSLRTYVPGDDDQTAFRLIEDAFNEWPDRDASRFEDWAPRTIHRRGFEPWQIRFAVDPSGTAVGCAFLIVADSTAYVDQLAVRKDQRGRGLARALLVDAFERGRSRGAHVSELSTDSRTGALGVYERVGMVVTRTYRHWMTDV